MRYRLTILISTCVALAAPAAAQVHLVEAGIICPRPTTGELMEAPGTEAGFIRQIDESLVFDLPDRIVPTMDRLSFGFRTGVKLGTPSQIVTVVITHPPMGPRDVTREEWEDKIPAGTESLNLFTFEKEYEKVPGPWTFEIEKDGETLVEVPFTVVDAGGSSRVEAACFQFLS
ncbi:hypothetical protein JSE7799_01931 [Jannaschia seosinensis]|uniref:DUF3859 domain-containing protein n=1 Tax=Jannaschia seosinensis TaxID=313367 RepID=A0A0M7BAW2_9RHOB|nr:DUF3859 domain-containing protein [Jannaschia seosinensis]CUH39208.1 hypothetical protein JSE7799_01931 [Jannaschia seosinensis]